MWNDAVLFSAPYQILRKLVTIIQILWRQYQISDLEPRLMNGEMMLYGNFYTHSLKKVKISGYQRLMKTDIMEFFLSLAPF